MNENKGVLIYDSSVNPVCREWNKVFKKDQLFKGAVCFAFTIFIVVILIFTQNIPVQTHEQAMGYYGLIAIALPLFILSDIICISAFLGKDFLRVYENGIVLPCKGHINTILKRTKYLPFEKIDEIYSKHGEERPAFMNPHPPYIFIKKKGVFGGTEMFHIKEIGGEENIDTFVSIMRKKVKKVNIKW